MSNIKSKISSRLRYLLKLPPPWVTLSLFERKYTVRDGTIRKTPDKDDGWLFACASLSTRIFDIGVNIGQSAFLELYPGSVEHVLLVDTNPMALSIAAENLIVNGLINRVNFECGFVSEQPGKELDFYTVLYGAAGSMFKTHAKTAAKRDLHFKVTTTTINLLTEKYGVPDFIKVDVEGAESFVLDGADEVMDQKKTRFLVEMHSSAELPMVENARRILAICRDLYYDAWYLAKNVKLESPDQLKDRGRCHLLLQPGGWEWPSKVLRIKENAALDSKLYNSIIGL
ncbi:MAG: FkbM family methyltransferase [Anaerolineaceae bacterium]